MQCDSVIGEGYGIKLFFFCFFTEHAIPHGLHSRYKEIFCNSVWFSCFSHSVTHEV